MMVTNNATEPEVCYCGQGVDDFHTKYILLHGYFSLLVCVFGSIANVLNIVVLTRREMRSPTNAILTGLAVADLLVMIDYIPYSYIEYILPQMNYPREKRLTYTWTWFVMFHSLFAQICHTISIWLTVTLAVWRYIAVAQPQKNRIWCNMKTTLTAIASSYVVCPLVVIPLYLSFSITPTVEQLDAQGYALTENNTHEARNVTLYKMLTSDLANKNQILMNVNFWIYSVVIKLIPCLALTILSLRLIGALLEAKRRRRNLIGNNFKCMETVNGKPVESQHKNSKSLEKEKQTDRTTKMLLAVLLLFLTTEFPQGILGLLSAVLGPTFFMKCYLKLGDFMDILALINSAINFILYCSMSRQFRKTFNILFRPKCIDRWMPVNRKSSMLGNCGPIEYTDIGGKGTNAQTTQVSQV